MACFEVTGYNNNLGTTLPSVNPNMQRLNLRGTSITTVDAGWDPYELAELDLQNCALTKQSKLNILQGFANRRIAIVSLNTFSNAPYNHDVVTDARRSLRPRIVQDEETKDALIAAGGGYSDDEVYNWPPLDGEHNRQYTKDPITHTNGVFNFETRDINNNATFFGAVGGNLGQTEDEAGAQLFHSLLGDQGETYFSYMEG